MSHLQYPRSRPETLKKGTLTYTLLLEGNHTEGWAQPWMASASLLI